MFKKKFDLAIINRSFWPTYPVIGEALLRLAERVAEKKRVIIFSQGKEKLSRQLKKEGRGEKVMSSTLLVEPKSNTPLLKRIVESLWFMIWVFFKLCLARPRYVYVSTDPPISVPFVVMLYSKIFNAKFTYHLQDIHPEITSIYLKKKGLLLRVAKYIDCLTLKYAERVIVLSSQMKETVEQRTSLHGEIVVLDNPSIELDVRDDNADPYSLVFCGNAGRLQRIPLLVEAIRAYYQTNPNSPLKFHFVGGGLYATALEKLSLEVRNVTYFGFLPPSQAAQIISSCTWGLLPIEDEVTRYAFPSKSSTYAASGLSVIAICGTDSSVGKWVETNRVGITVAPRVDELITCFARISEGALVHQVDSLRLNDIRCNLSFSTFVRKLESYVTS